VEKIRAKLAPGTSVEVWFQDEMRVGQKNKLTYRWARKGSRPRAAHDQRTQSTYLFGAVCPERGAGAALVLPACNCEAMQLHLDEIAIKVALGAHAIILLDQAGWHGAKALVVPNNIACDFGATERNGGPEALPGANALWAVRAGHFVRKKSCGV
jgi:hypothetical protein